MDDDHAKSKTLPNGDVVRLGDEVTGSYWDTNDIQAKVIGWRPGFVTVNHNTEHQQGLDLPDAYVHKVTCRR